MKEPINPAINSTTPGVLLKNAREEKGMSVVDVAARLCLSVQFIEDIEKDDYSHLSAPTYARGYVRSYAYLVGIPEQTIQAALDNTHMEFSPPKNLLPLENESRIPITQPSENSHPRSSLLRWGSFLVVLIVAGLVVMWWRGPANQNTPTASALMTNVSIQPAAPVTAPAPAARPNVPASPASPANPAPSATIPNLPPPAAALPSKDNPPAAISTPTSQAEIAPMQAVRKNDDSTPVQPSDVSHPRQKAVVNLPAPGPGDDD